MGMANYLITGKKRTGQIAPPLYDSVVIALVRFCLLTSLFVLAGCGSPALERLEKDGRILAFGDSLTFGTGVGPGQSYPAILSHLSGLEVVNAGVPGETLEQGLQRLPEEIAHYQPDLVILIEGGNDILRNRNPDLMRRDLEMMIRLIRNSGLPLILVGVPEKKLFSDSALFYRELADQYELVFDASLIGKLMRNPSMKSDPIHFNARGYREMAKTIYALLQETGAVGEG